MVANWASNRSSTATGSEAPPDTQLRNVVTGACRAARSSRRMYMVGTPKNAVTRSACTSSIASSASNLGCSTSVPPTRNVEFIDTVWPKVWNSGRQPSTTSSRYSGFASKALTVAFMTRFRWVSTAPFGCPVVPLV